MASLQALFHHIVLPPTLPFSRDEDHITVGKSLLQRVVQACGTLRNANTLNASQASNPYADACNDLVATLGSWQSVYGESVEKTQYHHALQELITRSKDNQVLALHIVEQNAALLVYRREGYVVFEAFEASAQSQDVLATPNSLVWTFPSQAAQIPTDTLVADEGLQLALASFLSKANSEHLSHFAAVVEKHGSSIAESRNPGSPALITHMLMAVIQALGSPGNVSPLKKRVRDDVNFRTGTGGTDPINGPWRRHPFWLILRIALRRHLHLVFGPQAEQATYKIIISMVIANLLRDATKARVEVTTVDLIMKKLCRRLAKLEAMSTTKGAPWGLSIPGIRSLFEQTIQGANSYIQLEFSAFKKSFKRYVPHITPRLPPHHMCLRLSLPSSGEFLDELASRYMNTPVPVAEHQSHDLESKLQENPGIMQACSAYDEVSTLLSGLQDAVFAISEITAESINRRCQDMCSILDRMLASLPPLFKNGLDPELNSQVCLAAFSIWVQLDQAITEAYPLLKEYRPPFPPELLDVLHLTSKRHMRLARNIHRHLYIRHQQAKFSNGTIYSNFSQLCFGARHTQSSSNLKEFLNRIRSVEKERREDKKMEWDNTCEKYDLLTAKMEAEPCLCIIDEDGHTKSRDCTHCFEKRNRWRLKIDVCEDLLPEDESLAAAYVFELNVPADFSAYRSSTWALLRKLTYPVFPASHGKILNLSQNQSLKIVAPDAAFFAEPQPPAICVASPEKTFHQTHYKTQRMWVEYEDLLVPCAASYSLYDAKTGAKTSDFDWPLTLAHLCGIVTPNSLAELYPRPQRPATCPDGPSSYQAVANRLQCPGDTAQHEFEAYHYLLGGRARRWPTLLAELGSANINFSRDDTLLTCTHLVNQIGPALLEETGSNESNLGVCHAVFADDGFVGQLLLEIRNKLDATCGSWRETNCMDLIITLYIAIYTRSTNIKYRQIADERVRHIRTTVQQWIEALRKEGEESAESLSAASMYSFRAALLGRRTFALFALFDCAATSANVSTSSKMGPDDIADFLKLSITLQQNRVVDITRFSRTDTIMLRRDAALSFELQKIILEATDAYPDAVGEAVAHGIGIPAGKVQSFVKEEVHEGRNQGWLSASVTTAAGCQRVDLDCLRGHILVDGKTLRKLPDDIRDSEEVRELFGQKHLLTYSSHIPGAVCRLAAPVDGFSIHFGRHNGSPVIMAEHAGNNSLSYLVPRRVFIKDEVDYDLPRDLVDDCVHWYDRHTGVVEIARKPDIFKSKPNNWRINVTTRQAYRHESYLVDPHSFFFRSLAGIFRNFEDAQRLTVYQPFKIKENGSKSTLKVELRHLDLLFSAKGIGLLVCQQLEAEIDPDQDAGTLYGYESMIVMRESHDHSRRSIIAPLGPLLFHRQDAHLSVRTNIGARDSRRFRNNYTVSAEDKAYVRFTIDPVLGRLVSPQEPRLLYTKALLHAYSSFSPLPDPLTKRTGSEEAMALLSSELCTPWEPLSDNSREILKQIRDLCPTRTFYPSDKRVLQQVSWSPALPPGVQNDRYRDLVDNILQQSDALKPFHGRLQEQVQKQEQEQNYDQFLMDGKAGVGFGNNKVHNANKSQQMSKEHLHIRAQCQYLRFQPPHIRSMPAQNNVDMRYKSRGQSPHFKVAQVREIARLLNQKDDIVVEEDLSAVLQRWGYVGGLIGNYGNIDEISIADLMSSSFINKCWGSLINLCVNTTHAHQLGSILVALCVMSFSPSADMDCVRWLAAFARNSALKVPQFPPELAFSEFMLNELPSQERLAAFVSRAYPMFSYRKDDDKWDVADEREKHQEACRLDSNSVAQKLITMWPHDIDLQDIVGMVAELPEESLMTNAETIFNRTHGEWTRLQRNHLLSIYAEEIDGLMQQQRLCSQFSSIVDLQKIDNTRRGKIQRSNEFIGLGRPEIAPTNIAARLCNKFVEQDMDWMPSSVNDASARPKVASAMSNAALPYKPTTDVLDLGYLIRDFTAFSNTTGSTLRADYISDLKKSLDALKRSQSEQARKQQVQGHKQGYAPETGTLPSTVQAERQEAEASETVSRLFSRIRDAFTDSAAGLWLHKAGLWPRITPTTLLELLRSTAAQEAWGKNVRERLLEYGCFLTILQQRRRILRAISKGDTRRAWDELRNRGHSNWKPSYHPDWLLLEIDSDMLIRAHQVDVARALLAPTSQANAVLQLNMGQGKTSCIVPMAMAALADGEQLARLIVPKALIPVTAQTVQSRLGGLVGRQVRHLAFSRRLLSRPDIQTLLSIYENHHEDLLQRRGILLAAPEHLLAFKLCGLQYLADCHDSQDNGQYKLRLAQRMIFFQGRLANELCRDVLDESDVILSARTQLVYPSGAQTAVDGAPQRWTLAQELLAIVEDQLAGLCLRFPQGINRSERGTEKNGGRGFPMVQILQLEQVEDPLHIAILETLCGEKAVAFGAWAPGATAVDSAEKRRLLREALGPRDTSSSTVSTLDSIETAARLFADPRAAKDGLLLVHGLLEHRVLLICLRKRWNVQYGLHPKRWPIAVPFESKGVPSERSEFGHPDVAVLLTCLAFYYAGLTREQLRDGLRHILYHHDDPVTAYGIWMAGGVSSLPAELKQWNVVNPDDERQVELLWKLLRLTRPVIDHYLNTFVFPTHARQFSVKLQASSWDVALRRRKETKTKGTKTKARTTGFSGTNDNRSMLPLNIEQLDLDLFSHTNAEVLAYILQQRNREYQCCMKRVYSQFSTQAGVSGISGMPEYVPPVQVRWTEDELLGNLKLKGIRVLIDAGAYILEQDNKSLARAWLKVDYEAEAAIFFDESDNRAWVLFRDATAGCLPLVETRFVDERHLEKCLVYFDEAHTRGVDLALPPQCRGGITLALGQTKDQTMQAAMRLRQLGTTQSVLWYAPPEVDRSIRHVWESVTKTAKSVSAAAPTKVPTKLESSHVVLWLLEQTCAANEQLHPLYLSHGYDFCQRSAAEKRYHRDIEPEDDSQYQADLDREGEGGDAEESVYLGFDRATLKKNRLVRKQLMEILQQPERMTLDQLYGSSTKDKGTKDTKDKNNVKITKAAGPKLFTLAFIFQQLQSKGLDSSSSSISLGRRTNAAFEEVEQEREVQVQVEQVRAKKARVHFGALNFPGNLHWVIDSFLHSGGRLPQSHGLRQAFASIARSDVGQRHKVRIQGTASQLYVSVEFERTIQVTASNTNAAKKQKQPKLAEPVPLDQFYRPVQWLLWSRLTGTAIVVVPEEAELLLMRLRRSQTKAGQGEAAPQIHLLLYSAAVTRAMVELSSGAYYAVPSLPAGYVLPSWLTIEVGILGGRLYMTYSESEEMRTYLEMASAEKDGPNKACPNLSSFLLDWLPLRRTGQDISHTPAAYVCQGLPLNESHAFFMR